MSGQLRLAGTLPGLPGRSGAGLDQLANVVHLDNRAWRYRVR